MSSLASRSRHFRFRASPRILCGFCYHYVWFRFFLCQILQPISIIILRALSNKPPTCIYQSLRVQFLGKPTCDKGYVVVRAKARLLYKETLYILYENAISLWCDNLDGRGWQATLLLDYSRTQFPSISLIHYSHHVASFDWLKLFFHYVPGKGEKSMGEQVSINLKLRSGRGTLFLLISGGLSHMS